ALTPAVVRPAPVRILPPTAPAVEGREPMIGSCVIYFIAGGKLAMVQLRPSCITARNRSPFEFTIHVEETCNGVDARNHQGRRVGHPHSAAVPGDQGRLLAGWKG